jgi:peptide chain release factor subunit 1
VPLLHAEAGESEGRLKNHESAEDKVLLLNNEQEKDRTNFLDKETNVEMEVLDRMALLEWMANNYKTFGAMLEIVTDRSQEGAQFCKGFGGIGGLLRYKVDFQEMEYDGLDDDFYYSDEDIF